MEISDFFFYLFSALTLGFGFLCVANPVTRNPVTSAMFLVLAIVSLAGLFVLLHAFFLAAVQVLVYAGAVMVLFLFVIMLLDLTSESRRRINRTALVLGTLSLVVLASVMAGAVFSGSPVGTAAGPPSVEGDTATLGRLLFTKYLLPFEIISLVLLVAMVGAVLLSKKNLKQ